MAEWARVWKSVVKRWWRQARASWAAEALWIQERQALKEKVAEAYEAYTRRGVAEKGIKLDDVQADADYWRVQCMEVAKLEKITYICAHCGGFAEVPFARVEFLGGGTMLACDKCAGDTVVDLSTLDERTKRFRLNERIKELEEIVDVYEDKDFFDALAKTVIEQLRQQRDECRASLVRAHKLLVQDLGAVFPLAGEDVEQAKQAMLDAVKDYVEDLRNTRRDNDL